MREWVESENIWNALSNYPALLIEGEVNTDIFTIHTSNDKKFSVVSARHGIGLNQDASRIIYKSVVGDAQDLAQALLESGAYNAFQLDSG
ncbi:MAG: phosphodiester glycosidase family protein [Patescibacteria group bacterium]|nr:phosphodiester glycosidase family protein [Patescibacteria group bacterium]